MKLVKLFCLLGLFIQGVALAENTELKNTLTERVNKNYNVGIVVAVIHPNKTEFFTVGKLSKDPQAKAVDENTIFPVASVTKVFTTLLLADEVTQGKMHLHDPAQDYLPETIHLPTYQNHPITLEDLATHTAGLSEDYFNPTSDDAFKNLTTTQLYDFVNHSALKQKPGLKYKYSNLGISLLGDAIAEENKKPYAELLAEKITRPLGMSHTTIISTVEDANGIASGYSAKDEKVSYLHWPVLQPAGAMYSTAADLSSFISAFLGFKKSSLYPAMQLSIMPVHSEGVPMIDNDFPGIETTDIALGWNVEDNYHLIWKSGNIPGFSLFVGFNPVKKIGVVILTNASNTVYTNNIGMHILNSNIKLFPLYQEIKVDEKILDRYTGKYRVSDGTFYIFSRVGHHLEAQHLSSQGASSYFNIYPSSARRLFGKVSYSVFTFSADGARFVLAEEGKKKTAVSVRKSV